ncbi:MAG: ABC transporter substrate-binding protein, partial [Actinomycetota bacterium]
MSLVATACVGAGGPELDSGSDTTSAPAPPPTTVPTTIGEGDEVPVPEEAFSYNVGIFQDIATDNPWADNDSCCNSVWNRYVLFPTYGQLYSLTYPGPEVKPFLASTEEVPVPEREGDVWVARVPMVEGATWSDGEPITAHDVAFTWNTVAQFCLGGSWPDLATPAAPHPDCGEEDEEATETLGVLSVEAEDDHTVAVTFNGRPGLAIWGLGNGVWNMNVFPRHFWEPVVEEARSSDDPRQALITASGEGAPAAGVTVFDQHVEGSHARTVANAGYHRSGSTVSSGGVEYPLGPFADDVNFTLYGSQDAAVLGLAGGEVDFLLNPVGMAVGLQDQVNDNPDLAAIVNPINSFRYLGLNLEREPMSDPAFRDALAVIIDKGFVTDNLLQGVPYPVYSMVPEGNQVWHDPEVEAEIRKSQMGGASHQERTQEAVRILTEAGYSWDVTPGYDEDGNFQTGQGLIGPDGEPVRQLELLSPTPGYDPFRATFGQQIAASALELGIPVANLPTEFNRLIELVYTPVDGEMDYDMFILGWDLGNPAFPGFMRSFFGADSLTAESGGNNNTGFNHPEFEELLDRLDATDDLDEARDLISGMERILAEEKPYILLFATGVLEFYNSGRIQYPFTEVLG